MGGSGLSFFTRFLGTGVDNVLQFELVLADGTIQSVDACSDPDLFWALRGGGAGTFGVVISTQYKIYDTFKCTSLNFALGFNETSPEALQVVTSFFDFWLEKSPYLPNEVGGFWSINTLNLFFKGDKDFAERVFLKELNQWIETTKAKGLDVPAVVTVNQYSSYYEERKLASSSVETLPTGTDELEIAARLISRDDIINDPKKFRDMAIEILANYSLPVSGYYLGGKVSQVGHTETSMSPATRKALFQFHVKNGLTSDVARRYFPNTEDGGAGFNHGSQIEPHHERAFWGSNYARLLQMKKNFDPDHRFNAWHLVGYRGPTPSTIS